MGRPSLHFPLALEEQKVHPTPPPFRRQSWVEEVCAGTFW